MRSAHTAGERVRVALALLALLSADLPFGRALRAQTVKPQQTLGAVPVVTPEQEPNGTAASATPIDVSGHVQPAAIVSAAIAPSGDVDYFVFAAPAGSTVWISTDTGGTQNGDANSRDIVIDLIDADGTTVIETDDDDGTGNGGDGTIESDAASVVAGARLVMAGQYFVRVRGFTPAAVIDPYKLFVVVTPNSPVSTEVEPNDTPAAATAIVTAGSAVGVRHGSISQQGDGDYFSVQARAGNVLNFAADADPARSGAGADLVVELRDPANTLLLSVDSSTAGSVLDPAAEGASFVIPSDGTYFIQVRHFDASGLGPYDLMVAAIDGDPFVNPTPTINLETEPNDTDATANDIDFTDQRCAIASGQIDPAGDVDFFRFTGAAGSRIWIETDANGDTVVDLLAADGVTIIETDDDDGIGNGGDGTTESLFASLIGGRALTAGGNYFIRVKAFSNTDVIESYRLFVVVTNTTAAAEAEPNGTAATATPLVATGSTIGLRAGAISISGDVDYYSVAARAGNILFFAADADTDGDGSATNIVLELRSPADAALLVVNSSGTGTLGDPAAEGANYTITSSGTYYIKVVHASTGAGTYRLMAALAQPTTSGFTEDPVLAQHSAIRAVHLTELRARIDALRTRFGAASYSWTDGTLSGVAVKAVHVTELRTVLDDAYSAANIARPTYTDSPIVQFSTVVKAAHLNELRRAVVALESR